MPPGDSSRWQVAVVGAGPGGYAAAIRCAQLGMSTVCIDDRKAEASDEGSLGGTCLNVGCIPSKALLESSLHYSRVKKGHLGIKASRIGLNLAEMMQAKQQIVSQFCGGIAQLFKGYGVDALPDRAKLVGSGRLLLDSGTEIRAEQIILATGSRPMQLPSAPFDGERILDSTAALSLQQVPSRLCVIGAGAIGLELGSVWARLGAEVTVLEALEDFLPLLDRDMARLALRSLTAQGLNIQLGCRLGQAQTEGDAVRVRWSSGEAEQESEAVFDQLIVAVGRQPNTEGLLDEACGLQPDQRGFLPVDQHCRTALEGVWAVGDSALGPAAAPMLAHRATEEGVMVAERIAGEPAEVNYALVPSIIYTHPEIAVIGQTATDCERQNTEVTAGAFPFAANGRAQAAGDSEGKVKLIGEAGSGRLLGGQVVGASAGDLAQQVAVAMEFGAAAEDLALTMFGHPTLSEALHEAALDLAGKPLHQVKKRRQ